jgi:PPOX class probable F420-dependent enzyme
MVLAVTEIPGSHRDLLQSAVATLATIGPDGRPQLTEVWFLEDEGSVAISLNTSRQKTKNLADRPQCSLLVLDLAVPQRYPEIRGDAEISPDDDFVFAEKVGKKYGVDIRVHDGPGDRRVVIRIRPHRVNAVDMRG